MSDKESLTIRASINLQGRVVDTAGGDVLGFGSNRRGG